MRYISPLIFLFLLMLGSCSPKVDSKVADQFPPNQGNPVPIFPDTIYYGVCTDGTAMHTLQIATAEGDTLTFPMGMGDDPLTVEGGITIGSKLAVTTAESDGLVYARTVINLSDSTVNRR